MAPLPAPARALPADVVGLRGALLAWFDRDGRALAFRAQRDPDPWAVLVSEVMAQQTQVARVEGKWRAFMNRFPTPADLAAAPAGEVIRAWSGLGYNRRAIDLQRTARLIVASGGTVPADVPALQALPGVGPYTARAVAAIAFGGAVGAVDVNVRRVLGRLLRGDSIPVRAREVQAAADALVDPGRPADWTHALMDLGATVCRPSRPTCGTCPVRAWCPFPGSTSVAAHGPASRPARLPRSRRAVPFAATTRWLRGRIVDRLCSEPPGTGVAFHGSLGLHQSEAVSAALAALVADGLVELDRFGAARLAGERS